MSFLDLYQGDQAQAATIQPNEGHDLPSTFGENFHAAWGDGQLFSQSIARQNARAAVLSDYFSEIKQKTGNDLSADDVASGPEGGITGEFDRANARVADLKEKFPDLDLNPLSEDEINQRALAKAQATHRNYEALQAGERTAGGAVGSFLGSAANSAVDPVNLVALAVAPETGGTSILGSALRWGALAGVSQAAIEATSNTFKEQVQPGYNESGQPFKEIAGAAIGGAVLGGSFKALGNAWTRVKTGAWPTSVRDAGNVIESEANIARTNPFPGAEGEVAHRDALVKTIDAILANRPVDVDKIVTPGLASHIDAYHGSPHDFDAFDTTKIGAGEGAQSYGHGLYFAENPEVAKEYQERLGDATVDGKPFDINNPTHSAAQLLTDEGSRDEALAEINARIDRDPGDQHYRRTRAVLESDQPLPQVETTGKLYRVKITSDKSKFLDLDKQLNEQTPEVQESLKQAMGERWDEFKTANAKTAVRQGFIAFSDEQVSKKLSDAGIPGSKYLDQGSRSGEGTRNFVVFDDRHVQITHKNGKPVNAEIRRDVIDRAAGLPPKQSELPLGAPETEPIVPKSTELGPTPPLQTSEEMNATLTAPDHQDAIRADIDRERALGDVQVPGIDENGNHTMLSVDKAMDEVDAYKQAAEQIQACANPAPEEEAA